MRRHKYAILAAIVSVAATIFFYRQNNLFAVIFVSVISSVFYALYRFHCIQGTQTSKELSSTGGDADSYEPMLNENKNSDISFDNIAGMEEIKEELMEIADFLTNPQKYESFGASLPKGVLFYGPPGTGKTMIARALANEAHTDFIYASGSEFIEKYVGVGAGRIRSLFEKARKKKNCIIFIDEIDAIGASRHSDNNSERDQTLNQLLIELDGFNKGDSIVVIGATNRIDLLDKALIRPGRFDRHIYVGNPSESAREKILTMHMKGKPIAADVDAWNIAAKTTEMSGAQLANVVNEAALIAIRHSQPYITNADFDEAILKVTAGLKNRSVRLSERDKQTVAHHEAGHAVAHIVLCNSYPQQITIEARSKSLGLVMTGEGKDGHLLDTEELENRICVLLAGRAAESELLGRITTGAQNDLKRANEIALSMFTEFGMDESHINKIIDSGSSENYKNISEHYAQELLEKCYDKSCRLVRENKYIITSIAKILIDKKTINRTEIKQIFEKENLNPIAE